MEDYSKSLGFFYPHSKTTNEEMSPTRQSCSQLMCFIHQYNFALAKASVFKFRLFDNHGLASTGEGGGANAPKHMISLFLNLEK